MRRLATREVSIAAVVVIIAVGFYVFVSSRGARLPPGAIRSGGAGCTYRGAKNSAGVFLGPTVGLGLLCSHGSWVPARQDGQLNDFPLTSASDIRTARANAEIAFQQDGPLRKKHPVPPHRL